MGTTTIGPIPFYFLIIRQQYIRHFDGIVPTNPYG
jgi:hypothetical protein